MRTGTVYKHFTGLYSLLGCRLLFCRGVSAHYQQQRHSPVESSLPKPYE